MTDDFGMASGRLADLKQSHQDDLDRDNLAMRLWLALRRCHCPDITYCDCAADYAKLTELGYVVDGQEWVDAVYGCWLEGEAPA